MPIGLGDQARGFAVPCHCYSTFHTRNMASGSGDKHLLVGGRYEVVLPQSEFARARAQ
jgi:hypothetical protein